MRHRCDLLDEARADGQAATSPPPRPVIDPSGLLDVMYTLSPARPSSTVVGTRMLDASWFHEQLPRLVTLIIARVRMSDYEVSISRTVRRAAGMKVSKGSPVIMPRCFRYGNLSHLSFCPLSDDSQSWQYGFESLRGL